MLRAAALAVIATAVGVGSLRVGPLVHQPAQCASSSGLSMLLGMGGGKAAGPPRTVGEAKAAFQDAYKAPVPGPAQGFVNEMITAVTLATASPTYKYSPVFAVGYEALCDGFLEAIESEQTRTRIRNAMYLAVELDGKKVAKDAAALKEKAGSMTVRRPPAPHRPSAPISSLAPRNPRRRPRGGSCCLQEEELLALPEVKDIDKYSYPLGAGLLTLMPLVGSPPTVEQQVQSGDCPRRPQAASRRLRCLRRLGGGP